MPRIRFNPLALLILLSTPGALPSQATARPPAELAVSLSEWKIALPTQTVPPGRVRLVVTNTGIVPHGIEVEGGGIEKRIALIQPGATDTLSLTLKAGRYELYCPVGSGSHKKLGMLTYLTVGGTTVPSVAGEAPARTQSIHVSGGGPVVQMLPGPFPFPDSAGPVLRQFGDEKEGLESQIKGGPYSDAVARITGAFTFDAWDFGAVKDSVRGEATFTTQDGAQWRLVMDRVQTRDVPHHPRFGGVILGLYYHGNTGVHTPLVPTINTAVALWSFAHLYRNGSLVTDNAVVHVMLGSRTRRTTDFALQCWDCSRQPIEELQLQVLPASGEPKFDAPGGFLFINWERSSGTKPAR